jgi:hypothetical protein
MTRPKRIPRRRPPLGAELEKLLAKSDEELLQQARDEGCDIPELVKGMKLLIAEKLSEAAQRLSASADQRTIRTAGAPITLSRRQPRALPGTRSGTVRHIALEADIAGMDLGRVSYLTILQHGWTLNRARTVECEYRWLLQAIRDCQRSHDTDCEIVPSQDVDLYWQCHQMNWTVYQTQMTALFEYPLPRPQAAPTSALAGEPGLSEEIGRWATKGQT